MAEWIWFPGEYEIYHSILLHSRRQEFGADYPCFWLLPSLYPNVEFRKTVECKRDGTYTLHTNGVGYTMLDGKRYPADINIPYTAGKHEITVLVTKTDGLPAAFVEGDEIFSDESWDALYPYTLKRFPAGHSSAYTKREDNVEIFPFAYTPLSPVAVTDTEGGKLYDFGRETFAKLVISGVTSPVDVVYGESVEEATNKVNALLLENGITTDRTLVPRAFRYVAVMGEKQPESVTALYEYPNGATGVFVTTTGEAPGTNRLEIVGTRGKLVCEGGRLTFTRNEIPADEYSKTTKSSFGVPPVWNVDIPIGGGNGEQHIGIKKNFVAAILDGAKLIAPDQGLTFSLGRSTVRVVGPKYKNHTDERDDGLSIRIDYGATSVLVMGTVTQAAERELVSSGAPMDADVLICGMGGGEEATGSVLVNAVTPKIAFMTGKNPANAVKVRLQRAGCDVYTAKEHGVMTLFSDGRTVAVQP